MLNLLMKLLKESDEEVYEMIEAGSYGQPTFCISWILTWFAHDIEGFNHVKRIYDACLSQHPLFPLYLAVATMIYNRERLYANFDEDDP